MSEEGQKFHFGTKVFDVDKAIQILKNKPREPITLKMEQVEGLKWMARVDPEYAASIDLDKADPVILAPMKTKDGIRYMIIDGWHRLEKARQLNLEEFPALALTQKETKAIQVRR